MAYTEVCLDVGYACKARERELATFLGSSWIILLMYEVGWSYWWPLTNSLKIIGAQLHMIDSRAIKQFWYMKIYERSAIIQK